MLRSSLRTNAQLHRAHLSDRFLLRRTGTVATKRYSSVSISNHRYDRLETNGWRTKERRTLFFFSDPFPRTRVKQTCCLFEMIFMTSRRSRRKFPVLSRRLIGCLIMQARLHWAAAGSRADSSDGSPLQVKPQGASDTAARERERHRTSSPSCFSRISYLYAWDYLLVICIRLLLPFCHFAKSMVSSGSDYGGEVVASKVFHPKESLYRTLIWWR